MLDPVAALSSINADDVDHNDALTTMLTHARVYNDHKLKQKSFALVKEGAVINTKPFPIKVEPPAAIKTEPDSCHEQCSPKYCCGSSHELSSTSTMPLKEPQNSPWIEGGSDASTTTSDSLVPSDALRLTELMNAQSRKGVADQVLEQVGNDDVTEISLTSDNFGVAFLTSPSRSRIADLPIGKEKVVRLLQLKALEGSRRKKYQQHSNLKRSASRAETSFVTQTNHDQSDQLCDRVSITLKEMKFLTPNEYDDSELYGDFQHMWHILIPSKATPALLEHRGVSIQAISKQSDCVISIRDPEASPFKDDRLLRIYGKAKGISLAQRLIIASLRAYRAEKGDPFYKDLLFETPLVALPTTSITKAISVAISSRNKNELRITSPFVWLVERENVGKMMGRQGKILAAIRNDTGATIYIEDDVVPGTTERRITLIGSINSIAAALKEIKSRSGGRPEISASERLGQYFAIPSNVTGFLIGPQGSTIQSVTMRTGARLQLPSTEDLPLGSVNRILHIQGTSIQTEHASRVVTAKLRDFLSTSKCLKTLTPSSTGEVGDTVTIKAVLPSSISGLMLDNRGKLIREISAKAGAHTHFLAPHDDKTRVCVFTGEMQSVLRAQRLVLQVMAGASISSKRLAKLRKRKRDGNSENYAQANDSEAYYDYDKECEIIPRFPVRRQIVRRQVLRRQSGDGDENDDACALNDLHGPKYEMLVRQTLRWRPVTCTREHILDGYLNGGSGHEAHIYERNDRGDPAPYCALQARWLKRPAMMHQPLSRHQDAYQNHAFKSDNDSQKNCGQPHSASELVVYRQATATRSNTQRLAAVQFKRKVELVAPRLNSCEDRSRSRPSDRRRSTGVQSCSLGKHANVYQGVSRAKRQNSITRNRRKRCRQ